jgi:DNA (cytosine-5)-methyltransferase 1
VSSCMTRNTGRGGETQSPAFVIGIDSQQNSRFGVVGTLDTQERGNRNASVYVRGSRVRQLTPEECEALQGFPRGYTRIPWRGKDASECPAGHRYKALGNSMAVNCMRWIGDRIEMVGG